MAFVLRSHVIEPKYPLVVEKYINLGEYSDIAGLKNNRGNIISLFDKYRSFHKRVQRLCSCAASLDNEIFELGLSGIPLNKLYKKSEGIVSREIVGTGSGADTKKRFLSAISPVGFVTLFETVLSFSTRVFVLDDNYGMGHFLLLPILKAAENANYKCYACYSPLQPERLEHLLIPELELSFVTSTKNQPFTHEYFRRIRVDAIIQPSVLRDKKQKITFSRKLSAALVEEACETLAESKKVHDELETAYNPYIDFDAIYSLADKLGVELINRPYSDII